MSAFKKTLFTASILASLLSASTILSAETIVSGHDRTLTQRADIATDQIIIRFNKDNDALENNSRREEKLQDLTVRAGIEISYARSMSGRSHVLKLADRLPQQAMRGLLERLRHDPDVESVEADAVMQSLKIPNDTFYNSYHWQYHDSVSEPGGINLPAAWDVTTGSNNVVISVIDTGILPHADLAGRTVAGYDFISTAFVGNDGNGRDNDPTDAGDWSNYGECYADSPASYSSWHGTHVAGTIGAASNNGYGVTGVNWVSKIQPVRVLGKCGGYTSDIADAIRWSAGISVAGVPNNATPAQVINMSLGGGYVCSATGATQLAINDAVAQGTSIVVAAGNSNMDASGFTPAGCNNVISVAANNRAASKTYYSNYGSTVEISAPGGESPLNPDGILSTLDSGSTYATGDNVFAFYQGTSMAAPHIAGVVSLMISANHAKTGQFLSPSTLSNKLLSSARSFPAGSSCTTALCGDGIADASRGVNAVSTSPVVSVDADITVGPSETVILVAQASDDGSLTAQQWTQVAGTAVALNGADSTTASFISGTENASLSFRFTATDDVKLSSNATITVTVVVPEEVIPEEPVAPEEPIATDPVVNTAPVASALSLVTEKNTPVSSSFSASDADGDALNYNVTSAPSTGSVSYDANTGGFTYTPKKRFTGTDTFSYVANDGAENSTAVTVTITINGSTKGGGGGKTTDGGSTKKGGPKK
ncbi:MAG: S8 family serine peptidase [Sulfuriflexus sp.]|nr:S8 family serine peptidase [Sulfuriflexus sp.]